MASVSNPGTNTSLISQVGATEHINISRVGEEQWIEVIKKMDEVYTDLVHSQIELERKNLALEEAHIFIRSILSSMSDVLIVCDTEGVIEQTNIALERLTGYDANYFKGHTLHSMISDKGLPIVKKLPEKMLSKECIVDCEIALLNSNQEEVEISVNCSPRYDPKGRLVGMVMIGRPVGELRQAYLDLDRAHRTLKSAQQRLISSEKMAALGRLVAGVSHELNNPISFVFGNMHALKRYSLNITEYLKALDRGLEQDALQSLRTDLNIDKILSDLVPLAEGTLEGAERVSEIVQDLRRFSSGEQAAYVEFDMVSILQTAMEWVSKATKGNPKIEFNCQGPILVHARKGHVHQIIINLVQNAFDAMAGSGTPHIIVDCRKVDGELQTTIRDFGPGILKKHMPHIFEPFFTTKTVGEGTGLGLYISYEMAKEQGGSLTARNHPGGGAIFTLRLPLETSNAS